MKVATSCLTYSHSLHCVYCTHSQQRVGALCEFKMDVSIPNPARCEVCSVFRFLNAKGEAAAEIHCQIVSVYGDVMNRRKVAKWCREFNAGKTDIHDEERTDRQTMIDDKKI